MSSRRWESKAKESVERAVWAEVERDVARHEVSMAKLDAEATRSTRAQMEFEFSQGPACLGRFRGCPAERGVCVDRGPTCLGYFRRGPRKAEDEASRLVDERVSLLLELEANKEELIGVRAEASKEKKALEKAFDAINYG